MGGSHYGHVNQFDVARLGGAVELRLVGLISFLEVVVGHGDFLIVDSAVRHGGDFSVGQFGAFFEAHLCRNGVRDVTHGKEHVELVVEQFLAELLFGVGPEVLDEFELLHGLGVLCLLGLGYGLVVVFEESLKLCEVKLARLLVGEDAGHHLERLCFAAAECFLHFAVGHEEAELIGFVLDDFGRYELLPHLLADLVGLAIGERAFLTLHLLLQLAELDLFVHKVLEILNGKFFSIHFAHLAAVDSGGSFDGAEKFFSNESKKSQAEHTYEQGAFLSDGL